MIRELHNLKCKAISVEVPEESNEFVVDNTGIWNNGIRQPSCLLIGRTDIDQPATIMYLPEGQWKILGRVNELKEREMLTLYYGTDWMFDDSPIYDRMDITWDIYCHENNLTNELILIEQP